MLKALWLTGILAFGGFTSDAQNFPGPSSVPEEALRLLNTHADVAWKLACEAKQVNCHAFVQPLVAYTLLTARLGQYTYNNPVVLVDIRLIGQDVAVLVAVLVAMHEMIHYLQWATGASTIGNSNYMTPCQREEEAFRLTYKANQEFSLVLADEIRVPPREQIAPQYGCEVKRA